MRRHIDLVASLFENVIQFPGRNPESRNQTPAPVFTPNDRFSLIVTKATETPEGRRRGIAVKRHMLTLDALMSNFDNYRALPREPDEARFWQSVINTDSEGHQFIYDLHVFVGDNQPLSLEQFNAINRMIGNDYMVSINWQTKDVANDH